MATAEARMAAPPIKDDFLDWLDMKRIPRILEKNTQSPHSERQRPAPHRNTYGGAGPIITG